MANLNVGDIVLTLHQLRPGVVRPAIVLEVVDANTAHIQEFDIDRRPAAGKNCPVLNNAQLAAQFMAAGKNICCYPKTA